MGNKSHEYTATVLWTGNIGKGTGSYKSYIRTWDIISEGKPIVHCSNDPLLGGDPTLHNPEDLLIASLTSCHMLWYLHLCAVAGITVTSYKDTPVAIGELAPNGAGRFISVTLKPQITITNSGDTKKAEHIHHEVHQYCFIARSVNFPVDYQPQITVA